MPKTLRSSLKWIFPVALLGAFATLGLACGSSDGSGDSTGGTSGGNGCVPGAQSACDCPGGGVGIQICNATGTGLEPCDCSNIGNTGSTGTGSTSCGNGVVDSGEECDDGNNVDADGCNTSCTTPTCGNGIVDLGEDCDDGNNSEFDACPSDCQQGGTGGMGQGGMGQGGDPCAGVLTWAGVVAQPKTTPFSAGAAQGKAAADIMCQQIGADHMCDYLEVQAALAAGELNNDVTIMNAGGAGITAWVHRTTTETINTSLHPDPAGSIVSVAGPGGRCNEWTYTTNHISDGEYVELKNAGGNATSLFFLDNDTFYDGADTSHTVSADNGAGGPVAGTPDTLQCNGVPRYVPCCYQVCMP